MIPGSSGSVATWRQSRSYFPERRFGVILFKLSQVWSALEFLSGRRKLTNSPCLTCDTVGGDEHYAMDSDNWRSFLAGQNRHVIPQVMLPLCG